MATTAGLGRHCDNDSEGDDGDPQLQRLLRRLHREHSTSTNFGNSNDSGPTNGIMRSGGVNHASARYLLEASTGNVGLASTLY